MVSVGLLLISLSAGISGGAVRVKDLAWTSDQSEDPEHAACLASLRSIVTSTSFRDFLRPIVDGTYRIRKKDSKEYLALSRGRDQIVMGKATLWTLKRQKRLPFSVSMPTYTLRSPKARGYKGYKRYKGYLTGWASYNALTREKTKREQSHWHLRLGTSGKSYALQNAHASQNAHHKQFLVTVGAGGAGGDGYVALSDDPSIVEWELELVKKPWSDRFKYRSRKQELMRQLAIASELPVIPESNSRMTWAKMCSPKDELCQEFYLRQRERFVGLGLMEETKDSVVTEVTVSGLCDMHPTSLREMLTSRVIVQDLYVTDAGANCTYFHLSKYSRALRQVVVDECFAQCIDFADSLVEEILETEPSRLEGQATKCSPRPDTNFTAFFEKVMDSREECARLPSDTVEVIVEHVIQQRCWSFRSQDGLLWKWNDQLPQNLDSYDHASSCIVMDYDAQESVSREDIFQQGTCPEGTACDCPETSTAAHETIFDIRQQGEMTIFVTEGSARLPSLLSAFARDMTKEKGQWRCTHSVGCWPVRAERKNNGTQHVCRMGDEAQQGGSPVWFMPPPGLQIEMVKLSWGRSACKMKVCSGEDTRLQKVGFSNVNVYNCQPLTFGDMTPDQKGLYLELLSSTGVFEEYTSPDSRVSQVDKEMSFLARSPTPTI